METREACWSNRKANGSSKREGEDQGIRGMGVSPSWWPRKVPKEEREVDNGKAKGKTVPGANKKMRINTDQEFVMAT